MEWGRTHFNAHSAACAFPPALHPEYERIKAECDPWILALTKPASQAATEFWLACAFPLFGSLTYAHGAAQRVVLLSKLMAWFFTSDTDDDDPSMRGCMTGHDLSLRHELILACYAWPCNKSNSDTGTASEPAYAGVHGRHITKGLPELHSIWKDISPDMPVKLLSRYVDAMRDHLNANRLQAHYRKAGRLPGLDEYVYALRRPTSLVMPCLILIEYALGIELDEETIGDETMMRLLDAVTDHVALANDLLSCGAERCYHDYFNLPGVIFRERAVAQPGYTSAKAMDEAVSVVEEVDKQCVQLMKEVESSRLIVKSGVRAYLRGLELWMAGNIEWSLRTARYSHTCSDEGLVLPVDETPPK